MLADQLRFCAKRQAKKPNAYTGAEPGKMHHEYPGVLMRGRSTEYNACDSTALFLLGLARHASAAGNFDLFDELRAAAERATAHILSHVQGDLFVEDPIFSGADRFALRVTYWKDSELIDRPAREPIYPVTYTLAHVLALTALRSAAELFDDPLLLETALHMRNALHRLWDDALGCFYIAKDRLGPVCGVSSDTLHALAYLEPFDIPVAWLRRGVASSCVLETPIGYRGLDPSLAPKTQEGYHSASIWPFEQAFIHWGAQRFGLSGVGQIASRIVFTLAETDAEIFTIEDNGKVHQSGCDPQLWTIAAKRYFSAQGITALR